MDIKELQIINDRANQHWYYRSKTKMVLKLLRRRTFDTVADIGAGSGIFARSLLQAGVVRQAVCVDPAYPKESSDHEAGLPISFVKSMALGRTADLFLFMDVLEHVDNASALLRAYTQHMRPSASIVITVPAFQFLWSSHDIFLEHKRRYTLAGIEAVVRDAGLTVMRGRYFFGMLFPLAVAARLKERLLPLAARATRSALKPSPAVLNLPLVMVHDVERHTLFSMNRIAGLTAVCLARSGS